jgi:hypothetical protein
LCSERFANLKTSLPRPYNLCCVMQIGTLHRHHLLHWALFYWWPVWRWGLWSCLHSYSNRVTNIDHRPYPLFLSITDITCLNPINVTRCCHRYHHPRIDPFGMFLFRQWLTCHLQGHFLFVWTWLLHGLWWGTRDIVPIHFVFCLLVQLILFQFLSNIRMSIFSWKKTFQPLLFISD